MSSELLGSAQNVLKGNLGGAWDITNGYQDAYTDLGIARRFGGASAAYSLRDIGAMNGPVVDIRRDTGGGAGDDDVEPFSALQLLSGAAEEFVGTGNDGFVSKWYDQTGNGNHVIQSGASEQPKIVDSGTYLGSLKFDAATDGTSPDFLELDGTKIGFASSNLFLNYVISNKADQSAFAGVIGSRDLSGASGNGYNFGVSSIERPQVIFYDSVNGNSNSTMGASQALGTSETALITIQKVGNDVDGFKNGTAGDLDTTINGMGTSTIDRFRIGTGDLLSDTTPDSLGLKAELKEIIFYETDRSSDRTDIENDILNYYSI